MTSKTEIAAKYAKKYNGKLSKRLLGKKLHYDYPDLYKDPEDARKYIRRVTETNGKERINKDFIVNWKTSLPKPEKNDYSHVVVNQKRIGIISDVHFPYYDEQALNAAINYLIQWKPDCVILNGDIIDCYQLSNFEKDKRQRSFKYELDMLAAFFVELRQLWPKERIIYKVANHEERYERQILSNVPELIDLELFNFENVIQAKRYNIEVVKGKRIIKVGQKLNVLHAHEFSKGVAAPVNPARGFFIKAKASTIGGHHHQSSEHIESDLNGNIIGCWSTGCLCELNPHYMPINKWNHGFAVVENYGHDFMVRNLKIIKGKVL
jgi:predicted phosphodiesterase